MKVRGLTWVVVWLGASMATVALAQASAPVAKPAASAAKAPKAVKPSPKLMTPEEKRDTATHDLQPERQVVPQIRVPLSNKGPVPAKPSGGRIDDAAARCKAEATAQARAACRDRLAH